jgi:hypothetical protein
MLAGLVYSALVAVAHFMMKRPMCQNSRKSTTDSQAVPQLHQIQIQFVPREDRALLRIKTTDKSEFRFWMTRRYVKLLWPVVVKMLEADQQIQLQENQAAKSAVLSFQHEKALQKSDFSTQFAEDSSNLPLGETPVLLARIQLKRRDDGGNVLCMHPEKGEGIELGLNEVLLHSFTKLLADAVSVSGWDVDLKISSEITGEETTPNRIN